MLVTISSKRDLSVFMKLGSIGTFCVVILIVFVIYEGILSLTDTKYAFSAMATDNHVEVDPKHKVGDTVMLFMFNTAFAGFG